MSIIDRGMSDWRTKFCGQYNPLKLEKIRKNLHHVDQLLESYETLLDVGCNIGAVYEHLGHKNYRGIDLDPDLIAKARSRFPEVDFQVCDLFDIEGQWDVVLVSRVLMHIAPFDLAMKKLLAAARKRLILIVPIADRDTCDLEKHDEKESYFRRFSEKSFQSMGKCSIYRYEPYSTVVYD